MSKITVRDIIKTICILQNDGRPSEACSVYAEILDDGSCDLEDWPYCADYDLLAVYFDGFDLDEKIGHVDKEIRDVLKSCKTDLEYFKKFDIDWIVTNPKTKSLISIKEKIGKEIERMFNEAKVLSGDSFISDPDARPLSDANYEPLDIDLNNDDSDII